MSKSQNTTTFETLRKEAMISATRTVLSKLEKPEGLEKLEQLRNNAMKQKTLVDTQLKSALYAQLGNIRTGIEQLKTARQKTLLLHDDIQFVNKEIQQVAKLNTGLSDLRKEVYTFRQLSLAKKNIDYIFDVPESVTKAKAFLEEDNILPAHKLILDLESSRNYLYFELYKTNEAEGAVTSPEDEKLLVFFFKDVQKLAAELVSRIRPLLSRCLETGRQAPEQLVSAFRIIEREEYLDQYWQKKHEETGFKVDDRPRKLRKMFFDLLNDFIKRRIQSTLVDNRNEHKMWLVRHLELVRLALTHDLKEILDLSERCFPPSYNILTTFVEIYHNEISDHLKELSESSLNATEIFSMLQWITQYKSKECMGNPELGLDLSNLKPLIDADTMDKLTYQYANCKKSEMNVWIKRCIDQEVKDWYEKKEVMTTSERYFVTCLPAIFEPMISQSLEVAISMGPNTVSQLLEICLEKTMEFSKLLEGEIMAYAHKYFDNVLSRNEMRTHFTKQMVANANNCETFPYIISVIWNKSKSSLTDIAAATSNNKCTEISSLFIDLAERCCEILIKEIETDLAPLLSRLMTRDWLTDSDPASPGNKEYIIDITVATFDDYYGNEYVHLKKPLLHHLCYKWHLCILSYYLKGIFQCMACIPIYALVSNAALTKICEWLAFLDLHLSKALTSSYDENKQTRILCMQIIVRIQQHQQQSPLKKGHSSGIIMNRNILKFSTLEERRTCANKMSAEADKLTSCFKFKDPYLEKKTYYFGVIKNFAELLRQTDFDSLVLDIASIGKNHPSFTVEQAMAVLLLRGDFTKSEAREKAESALGNMPRANEGIFASLVP